MGLFRLIKGELKKIFLKSGIFVVTALLVVVLVFSAALFQPNERNKPTIVATGKTVSQVYDNSFGSSALDNYYSKTNILAQNVTVTEELVNYYSNLLSSENNSKKAELQQILDNFEKDYNKYKKAGNGIGSNWEAPELDELRTQVKTDLDNFSILFSSLSEGNGGYYYILLSETTKEKLSNFLTRATTEPFIANIEYRTTYEKIEELQVRSTIQGYLDEIENFTPSQQSVDKAKEYIETVKANLQTQENDILDFKSENAPSNDPDLIKEIKNKILRYKLYAMNLNSLVKYTFLNSGLENFSDSQIQNFYVINKETYTTKYKINETKLIYEYYLTNNTTELDYANPLSFEETSDFTATGYDFMYFALSLCSFVIIAYILFLGAGMIAGEQTTGTLKQLAIRPYSRKKLLLSKLLSTVLVGIIFLTISFVVTLIIGGVLYGLESLPMLFVFNSTNVVSVSPIVLLIVLFLCLLMQIIFYAVLSLSISTLFKSNSGSIVVSILIYVISIILSMFITSLGFLKFLPFVNVNLFGYFGSNMVYSGTNVIARMFTASIPNDFNFYISLALMLGFTVVLYTVTSVVFSKRDIK